MSTKLFDLTGKLALVTGSRQGIGRGIVTGLARAGARVAVNARSADRVEATVASLRAEGLDARACVFDVTDSAAVDAAIDALEARDGPLDIVVNNAGGNVRRMLAECTDAEFMTQLAMNLGGPFMVARRAARSMIPRRSGKIINISSVSSELVRAGSGPYATSKGGLTMLTRSMAVEWAPHNIQVNAIAPSYNRTELMEAAIRNNPGLEKWVEDRTPAGRWSDPMRDLSGAAIFFASAASDFVTGQLIFVDGGFSVTF